MKPSASLPLLSSPRRRDCAARLLAALRRLAPLGLVANAAFAQTTLTFTDGQTDATAYDTGSGLTLTIASGSATQSGILSGTGGIAKTGAGKVVLSADNTFTGSTTISAGSLQIGDGGTTGSLAGSGTITVASGASLLFNRSDTLTHSGVITGQGSVAINATGMIPLSGANTYSGGTILNSGTLALGSNSAISTGPLTINGGEIRASGAMRNLTNPTTLNGSFTLGRSTILSGAITLGNDITITSANPDTAASTTSTLGGVISGAHGLTFTEGANPIGTIVVSGANTYTGATTLNAGPVAINADNRLGAAPSTATAGHLTLNGGTLLTTASFTVNANRGIALGGSGGTLSVNTGTLTYNGIIAGSGGLTKAGTGTLVLGGVNTHTGGTTLTAGTLTVGSGATLSSNATPAPLTVNGGTLNLNNGAQSLSSLSGTGGTIALGAGHTLTIDQSGTTAYSGTLTGSGALTKSGAGTLTLSGNNTYSGGTTVSSGTLALGQSNGLGSSGTVTIATGATFDTSGHGFDLARLAGTGAVTTTGTFSFASAADRTVFNSLADNGFSSEVKPSLTKSGAGTLVLSGDNAFGNGTLINQGKVILGSANGLGSEGWVSLASGATLDTAAHGFDLHRFDYVDNAGTLTGSGVFSHGPGGNSYTTVGASLTGTASLLKTSDSVLTLSGDNTFSGGTTIQAGQVIFTKPAALGTGGLAVASGATAAFMVGGTGEFTSLDDIASRGTFSSGAHLGVDVTNAPGGAFTDSGSHTGDYGLVMLGGNLTLSGTNTYTGGTTILAGTLVLGRASALGSSGTVTVATGATLDASTYGVDLARLAGTGTVTTSRIFSFASDTDRTVANILAGPNSSYLTKSGAGTLTLTGNNTYSGGTSIEQGRLVLGSANGIGSSDVNIASGATLDTGSYGFNLGRLAYSESGGTLTGSGVFFRGSGGNYYTTIGTNLTGSASFVHNHDGIFTLSGDNTFSGGTTIQSGTVLFTKPAALGTGGLTVATGATAGFAVGGTGEFTSLDDALSRGTFASGARLGVSAFNAPDSTFTDSGSHTGDYGLTLLGGTVVLTGNNAFAGGITLNGYGALRLGSAGAIGDSGTIRFNDPYAALQWSAANTTDYSARFSTAPGQTYTLDTNGQNVALATPLSSTGASLWKLGAGTLTLAAAPGAVFSSIAVEGGTLDLGGHTFDLNQMWMAGSSSELALTHGTIAFSADTNGATVLDGILGVTLAGSGDNLRFYLGGGGGHVYLNGTTDLVNTTDHASVRIGELSYGGNSDVTVTLGNANALAAATEHVVINAGTLDLNGVANVRANSIQLTGSSASRLVNNNTAATASFAGPVVFNGYSQVGGNGDLLLSGTVSGNDLVKIGAGTLTLSGANTYGGTTQVTAGTLLVNGSLASTVTVDPGATLGGSGTLGGLATLAGGAHLAPGNSPGTLTFAGGLALSTGTILDFELGSTSDLILVTGGTLSGPLSGTITVNLSDSGGFAAGTYTLLDATGASLSSIGATSFDLGTIIAGYTYTFSQSGNQFRLTATSAIPEPAAWTALAGLAGLTFAARRRRRRA